MIKSLLEHETPDDQTKEYIKELDLSLAERDISTRRIERHRADLESLRKELAQWRHKCAQAERHREENYLKYKELQREVERLEDERRAKRDRSPINRSSPNLSASSSMVGSQIPPPPPPADITYDDLFNMTKNPSSSYLANCLATNTHQAGARVRLSPPPPPPAGDLV